MGDWFFQGVSHLLKTQERGAFNLKKHFFVIKNVLNACEVLSYRYFLTQSDSLHQTWRMNEHVTTSRLWLIQACREYLFISKNWIFKIIFKFFIFKVVLQLPPLTIKLCSCTLNCNIYRFLFFFILWRLHEYKTHLVKT